MAPMPGGEMASRPLHFIWIVDCSGSMGADGKIQALNTAIDESLPGMRQVAAENPNADVLIRAIAFSHGAQWHVSQPTKAEAFNWSPLAASGATDMGKALSMVAEQMDVAQMGDHGLPPVLVLISDGQPTDDYKTGLNALLAKPWGKKAVRIAIAVGSDADTDVLQAFINNPEIKPLEAKNADQLVGYIKWASTAVLKSASQPVSQAAGSKAPAANVQVPQAPSQGDLSAAGDVW